MQFISSGRHGIVVKATDTPKTLMPNKIMVILEVFKQTIVITKSMFANNIIALLLNLFVSK